VLPFGDFEAMVGSLMLHQMIFARKALLSYAIASGLITGEEFGSLVDTAFVAKKVGVPSEKGVRRAARNVAAIGFTLIKH
jgi:hypothetical protein